MKIGDGETRADGLSSLEMVPCRGMCAESPVVSINDGVLKIEGPADLVAHLRALVVA